MLYREPFARGLGTLRPWVGRWSLSVLSVCYDRGLVGGGFWGLHRGAPAGGFVWYWVLRLLGHSAPEMTFITLTLQRKVSATPPSFTIQE